MNRALFGHSVTKRARCLHNLQTHRLKTQNFSLTWNLISAQSFQSS